MLVEDGQPHMLLSQRMLPLKIYTWFLKRCYPCKNLSSVNIADSAVSETAWQHSYIYNPTVIWQHKRSSVL